MLNEKRKKMRKDNNSYNERHIRQFVLFVIFFCRIKKALFHMSN